MKLGDIKRLFVVVAIIGSLLIASPAIAGAFPVPPGEYFSELYLLGPTHKAEGYPYNISAGEDYSVYVNVGNHLGESANYALIVKLANQTDQMPNATQGTPSPLMPIYQYRFAVADNQNWTSLLTFQVSNASMQAASAQINTLKINDASFNVDKPAAWNTNSTTYGYKLFFELWLYNRQTDSMEFNNRYVSLQLNLTRTT